MKPWHSMTYEVKAIKVDPKPDSYDPLGRRGFLSVKIRCTETGNQHGDYIEFSEALDDGAVRLLAAKVAEVLIGNDVSSYVRSLTKE